MIWDYQHIIPHIDEPIASTEYCIFCKRKTRVIRDITALPYFDTISICDLCGWWSRSGARPTGREFVKELGGYFRGYDIVGNAGALLDLEYEGKELDTSDARQYLLAQFEKRQSLHPEVFEKVVGDVYKDLGFSVVVTAYQKDGGIDVILDDGSTKIGIQVKRTKNKISVEHLRSFLGALVCDDKTEGIFVTTSAFTRDAQSMAEELPSRGFKIDLVDADSLFSALEVQRRENPDDEEIVDSILMREPTVIYHEFMD